MHSFHRASNFTIHNLTQTENNTPSIDGFKLLQEHMVPSATHNSGERYDAPKCHPETRKAVISNIKSWVDSTAETKRMMWLHGPAGAGKSAIAQTTADDCDKEMKLVASFFFSRLAGRNKKDGLVATIAYQLCLSIPTTKEHIVKHIEKNPNIFKSNLLTQMQSLVVEPLKSVLQAEDGALLPRLIIIDGLDECEIKKDQTEIIEAVCYSIAVDSLTHVRFLLVSRPELDIRQAFSKDEISSSCTRLALDDSFDPDKDIDLYLRSHFQALKRQHVMRSSLPAAWPSEEAIGQIVKKSSGQFIYASTAIKYVSDPRQNPMKRLNTILKIRAENGDNPYTQLDTLYSSVLSICADYKMVASVFEAMIAIDGSTMKKSLESLELFLTLEPGEVMLLLADLHSIVDVNNIDMFGIRFHHASLHDFLVDSSRSHKFFIDEHNAHASISIHCLDVMVNVSTEFPRDIIHYSFDSILYHYKKSGWDDLVTNYILKRDILKPYATTHNRSGLSFNVVEIKSYLAHWISIVGDKDITANFRELINNEIVNRLKFYPRQEIIIIIYQLGSTSGSLKPALQLHKQCISQTKFDLQDDGIIDDLFVDYSGVFDWFKNLMETTHYIYELPEDIRGGAILLMLDIAADASSEISIECLENLLKNIPLPSSIADAVLEKWENMKLKDHLTAAITEEMDEYMRSNCYRALNGGRKANDSDNMRTSQGICCGKLSDIHPNETWTSAADAAFIAADGNPQSSNMAVQETIDALEGDRKKKKKKDRFGWFRRM